MKFWELGKLFAGNFWQIFGDHKTFGILQFVLIETQV
jgi:hypothetical protein